MSTQINDHFTADLQDGAEKHFLQMLDDFGLPTPDRIIRAADHVDFAWTDQKLIVRVDVGELLSDCIVSPVDHEDDQSIVS